VSALAAPEPRPERSRRTTATARFGSSRREGHDASAFYGRFVSPDLDHDTVPAHPSVVNQLFRADARMMTQVLDNSVALVVTSPPYFAGKEYEESLGENGVPATYFEYLDLLREVFAECKRVLEPGGRIAVNVANLGRRPFRSLSADVTQILQDLGLLLRGEVVWWKGRASGGSCAWGTFQRPSNPVLRDVTERIVIASKGRFDRALKPAIRDRDGYPSTATITRDEFLEATTDLWEIAPESATRVGHPAPFPVALPRRLIELYTYENDLVLDPFVGSGTTAVAAVRTHRTYLGFDTDAGYIERAEQRIAEEQTRIEALEHERPTPIRVQLPARPTPSDSPTDEDFQSRAVREGRQAKELAAALLLDCGFTDIETDVRYPTLGIEVNLLATDETGQRWAFDVSGAFTSSNAGLRRTDTMWKALGKAAVLREHVGAGLPIILLTTDGPQRGSAGYAALTAMIGEGKTIFDLIELLNPADQTRLRTYAKGLAAR
jgi:site-specific DNA-methyltransferase (adenine-specific)